MIANEAPKPSTKQRAPEIGFLPPGGVERAFILLIYIGVALLVGLSIVGTFYGLRDQAAPLATPLIIIANLTADMGALAFAVAVQIVLAVTQYGARLMAARDRRWWVVYLGALGISVYYNALAFYAPLTGLGVPALIAGALILAGDVVPEFAAVKRK